MASDSYNDLGRAPCVLYDVKCIGLVSLARDAGAVISDSHLS